MYAPRLQKDYSPTTKRSFFFLIVDDGAFSHAFPCGRGALVPFSAYKNLLRLAEEFGIQIVLACTTSFLDIDRGTPGARPHDDSRRLIDFLDRHADRILLADHGYSHQWGDRYVEFHDYRTGEVRPASEQEQHIEWSGRIYRSLGRPFPEIFVTPAHGWEPGVTDRLYAERGCRFLSTMLWLKRPIDKTGFPALRSWPLLLRPYGVYPDCSPWMTILPRLGLLIPAHQKEPGRSEWLRAGFAVTARSRLSSYLLHRRSAIQPHNYIAHIMNFSTEEALRGWVRLLRRISEKMPLVPTFEESLSFWRSSSNNATGTTRPAGVKGPSGGQRR